MSSLPQIYHLFGFPIAHSASPALHNYLFARLGLQHTYKLTPTTRIDRHMRALCHANNFGGASVTMPLKVAIACMIDSITEEARAIGAVNTLVPERDEQGKTQLVGTNTDWIGVKNALLRNLQPSATPVVKRDPVVTSSAGAGMVLGGGGAARAAVYALASLDFSPIYLVGRDAYELAALVKQFPHIQCIPVSDPMQAVNVTAVVGCVPAIPPITPEEHAADLCTRAILASPNMTPTCQSNGIRVFLDMCYKPRVTPLMLHAASVGWTTISGIEAMLEQGLAQARMWLAKSANPNASACLIPQEVEEAVRMFIRNMPDILVRPGEESPSDSSDQKTLESWVGAKL